ncbi:hypothetical protein [Pseudomonas sp. G2-4]|uniref:hypothetical protein n=1 Tax=Pseudomonas sp. G2-4 TaxID=1506334 RepID=UPI0024BAC372|nr:hypothetical protein [Pseudomonas sp. G2-4]WHS60268.1 hypothetical protein QNH97_28285 [Pseudomonas sp. G2-4]
MNNKKVGNFAFFRGQKTGLTFKTPEAYASLVELGYPLLHDKTLQIISLSIAALLQRKFLHPFLFLQVQTLLPIRAASIM